jgi:hypothetical protein
MQTLRLASQTALLSLPAVQTAVVFVMMQTVYSCTMVYEE